MKFFKYLKEHKVLSMISIIIIVFGFFVWKNSTGGQNQVTYYFGNVSKGTIVTSVSGSGQVSASNQLDIKPKASGDIIKITVAKGQDVKKGDVLIYLNASDAQKTVRDARANLESAKLTLQKLQQPADQLSITQAENSLAQAQESKQSAQNNLADAYDSSFNSIANASRLLQNLFFNFWKIGYSYQYPSCVSRNIHSC